MNSPAVIEPETRTESPAGTGKLYLRLLIQNAYMGSWLFPEGNRMGSWLLRDLLKARLEAAGVQVREAGSILDLNNSLFVFGVSDAASGLTVLRSSLHDIGLLAYAHLGWDNGDALVQYYPAVGEFPLPDRAEMEELERETDWLRGVIRHAEKSVKEAHGAEP